MSPLAVQIEPFRELGGIQTEKSPTSLAKRDALFAVGGYFYQRTAFTKRKGGEKFNETPAAAEVRGFFDFLYNNDTSQKIIIYDSTTYQTITSSTYTTIYSGLTAGGYLDAVNFNDYAWLVNGIDPMIKYDGVTATLAGIFAPSTPATAASVVGAGTLDNNGVYIIAVTFTNAAGEESNPSDFTTITLGPADNTINLTNVPISTDPQVTGRNIYISQNGGAVLALQGSIPDNVTTVYTILNSTTTSLLEFDHDVPPDGLVGIELFKDRLFAFKNNVVYFSKTFAGAWYFPQGQMSEVNFTFQVGNSENITAIKSFFDILLIFKNNGVYFLTGNNETDFQLIHIHSDDFVGSVSNMTPVIINNYCYFVGQNSVYRTDGVTIQDVGKPIRGFFDQNYSDSQFLINKAHMEIICAQSVKERNLFLFFAPTGTETVNNMCYAMDVYSISFDPLTNELSADWNPWPGFTTISTGVIVENNEQNWFRSDDLGYMFRQQQLDGDGSNITSTSTGGNGASTLNDTNQAMTVNLYTGIRMSTTGGTGLGQDRIIASNTATQFTVTAPWTVIPDATTTYTVGGIEFAYQHSFSDYGVYSLSKRLNFIRPYFNTTGNFPVELTYAYDFEQSVSDTVLVNLLLSAASFWDVSLWDVSSWDGSTITQSKFRAPGSRIHRWNSIRIENNNAGEPIEYNGLDKMYQTKGIR